MDETHISREKSELVKNLQSQIDLLKKYCEYFDDGKVEFVFPMSTCLRVLLKETQQCQSLLGQLGLLERMSFVDSAHHCYNGFCCWELSNVSHQTFIDGAVYAGLVSKKAEMIDDVLTVQLLPLCKFSNSPKPQMLPFNIWYNDLVIDNKGGNKMSRKNIIENISEKAGGCHVDPNMTQEEALFREPTSLKTIISGKIVEFHPEPIYTSLRQIAWEVLESV